jgi:hypothetical protein
MPPEEMKESSRFKALALEQETLWFSARKFSGGLDLLVTASELTRFLQADEYVRPRGYLIAPEAALFRGKRGWILQRNARTYRSRIHSIGEKKAPTI